MIITDIYPAREQPIAGVTSKLIYDKLSNKLKENCYLIPDLDDLVDTLDNITQSGDMILTMGAGDIWRYNEFYVRHRQSMSEGAYN